MIISFRGKERRKDFTFLVSGKGYNSAVGLEKAQNSYKLPNHRFEQWTSSSTGKNKPCFWEYFNKTSCFIQTLMATKEINTTNKSFLSPHFSYLFFHSLHLCWCHCRRWPLLCNFFFLCSFFFRYHRQIVQFILKQIDYSRICKYLSNIKSVLSCIWK